MATQLFADEELERLRGFPEIGRDELFRFFTLMPADVAFVDPGRGRGPADRLGLAVSLCTLPWLGFVPDKVTAAPPVAVARLAGQLNIDPAELHVYGRRVKTRQDHVRLVARYLGWKLPGALELKELDEFLLARAMEHDSPTLLFRLACEYLISAKVIRPGPVTVVERVGHARAEAQTGDLSASGGRVHRAAVRRPGQAAGGGSGADDDPAAVVGHRPGRGIARGHQGRGRQAGVPARYGRRSAGFVGAPG